MYGDPRTVKEIRHAFAHSKEVSEFTEPRIARLAESLLLPKRCHFNDRQAPKSPRACWVAAIEFLAEAPFSDMTRRVRGEAGESILQISAEDAGP